MDEPPPLNPPVPPPTRDPVPVLATGVGVGGRVNDWVVRTGVEVCPVPVVGFALTTLAAGFAAGLPVALSPG